MEPSTPTGPPVSPLPPVPRPFWPRLANRAAWELSLLRKRAHRIRTRFWRLSERRYRWTYARSLDRIPSRHELPELLNRRGLIGDAVEIGVKRGRYSEQLLGSWQGRRLISVDPWTAAAANEYVDRANVEQARHDGYYEETRARLAPFGDRSEIWRLTSHEAAARIADASLDFVSVDARHDTESVLEDLEAWFPKVRPGGILAGHDYADGVFPQGVFGVKSAVDSFFGARGISVFETRARPVVEMFRSWLVEIPGAG